MHARPCVVIYNRIRYCSQCQSSKIKYQNTPATVRSIGVRRTDNQLRLPISVEIANRWPQEGALQIHVLPFNVVRSGCARHVQMIRTSITVSRSPKQLDYSIVIYIADRDVGNTVLRVVYFPQ